MSSQLASAMTKEPISISSDVSIADAQEIMRAWGMRHLPVLKGERLVGLVSDRDILTALATKTSMRSEVKTIMRTNIYYVTEGTKVAEVARTMASNKFGCAVIVNEHERVVGIFTTVDALNLLARLLHEPDEVDYRIIEMKEYFLRRAAEG